MTNSNYLSPNLKSSQSHSSRCVMCHHNAVDDYSEQSSDLMMILPSGTLFSSTPVTNDDFISDKTFDKILQIAKKVKIPFGTKIKLLDDAKFTFGIGDTVVNLPKGTICCLAEEPKPAVAADVNPPIPRAPVNLSTMNKTSQNNYYNGINKNDNDDIDNSSNNCENCENYENHYNVPSRNILECTNENNFNSIKII
jgi:hypothetical protein